MSKFFEQAGSSEEEEGAGFFHSESEAELSPDFSEEDDVLEEVSSGQVKDSKKPGFFDIRSSDESSDEGRKVVKSQAQKLCEDIERHTDDVLDFFDQGHLSKIPVVFDSLFKIIPKVADQDVFETLGGFCKDIESAVSSLNEQELSKLDSKALISISQRTKRLALLLEECKPKTAVWADQKDKKPAKAAQKVVVQKIDLASFDLNLGSIPLLISILRSNKTRRSASKDVVLGLLSRGTRLCKEAQDASNACLLLLMNISLLLETQASHAALSSSVSLFEDFVSVFTPNFFFQSNVKDDFDPENTAIFHQQLTTSIVSRLLEYFSATFGSLDHHSPEYPLVLAESFRFCRSLHRLFSLLGDDLTSCKLAIGLVFLELAFPFANCQLAEPCALVFEFVYKKGSGGDKIKSFLWNIMLLSRADRYDLAASLWEQSKLHEILVDTMAAPKLLVSYHRAMAYLGIAAFRSGNIRDCYLLLQELCSSGKPKDLLGQQISHSSLFIPFHLHINVELLDAIFSIASLIMEGPQIFMQAMLRIYKVPFDNKRLFSFQCRHLRRLLDSYDKALFTGPPENTRELIVNACKDFFQGDVPSCLLKLGSLRIWKLYSDADVLIAMLSGKLAHIDSYIRRIDVLRNPQPGFQELENLTEDLSLLLKDLSSKSPDVAKNVLSLLFDNTNYFRSEDFKHFIGVGPGAQQ